MSPHSLYLIKLFSFSNFEGNFSPDGSISLLPPPSLPSFHHHHNHNHEHHNNTQHTETRHTHIDRQRDRETEWFVVKTTTVDVFSPLTFVRDQ